MSADKSSRRTDLKKNKNHPSLSPPGLWQSNTSRRGVDTAVPAPRALVSAVWYRGRQRSEHALAGEILPALAQPRSIFVWSLHGASLRGDEDCTSQQSWIRRRDPGPERT